MNRLARRSVPLLVVAPFLCALLLPGETAHADSAPSASSGDQYTARVVGTGDTPTMYVRAMGVWDPTSSTWVKLAAPGGVLPVTVAQCRAGVTTNTSIPTTAGGTAVLPSAGTALTTVCVTNYSTAGTQVWCQWDGSAPAVGTGWPIPASSGFCQDTNVVPKCIGDGATATVAATPCRIPS